LGAKPPVLILSGSVNPVTLRQVQAFAKRGRLVTVDVQRLLLTESEEQQRLVREVAALLNARQDVVIATAAGEEAIAKGQGLGRDLAIGAHLTGARVASALGGVVAQLAERCELSGLVLAGGETALGACRALGGGALRVLDELLPAIPLCRLDANGRALRVVTKSGGFGAPDALVVLAERLKRLDTR
jgi:uncharacterized protein YgbK (DUF1537 family)